MTRQDQQLPRILGLSGGFFQDRKSLVRIEAAAGQTRTQGRLFQGLEAKILRLPAEI